jgi:hypothetical protein
MRILRKIFFFGKFFAIGFPVGIPLQSLENASSGSSRKYKG